MSVLSEVRPEVAQACINYAKMFGMFLSLETDFSVDNDMKLLMKEVSTS